MHNCSARYCKEQIDESKEFCDYHWGKLPFEIQERICEAYKSPLHEGRQPNPKYAVNVTQAIRFLATKGF